MDRQDESRCEAFGCAEPRQTSTSTHCVKHQGEIWRFHLWLDGWDDKGRIPRSFEVERSRWETGSYRNAERA